MFNDILVFCYRQSCITKERTACFVTIFITRYSKDITDSIFVIRQSGCSITEKAFQCTSWNVRQSVIVLDDQCINVSASSQT